jgi:hypothetical protein
VLGQQVAIRHCGHILVGHFFDHGRFFFVRARAR